MVIDYNILKDAIDSNNHSESIKEEAVAILSLSHEHNWLVMYEACRYLFHFYSETGQYDKTIIDGLENVFTTGLNITSSPDKFIEAKKIQARLYFKYNNYRKASSSLILLTENADPTILPDWVFNYLAKINIHTEIDYYLLEPDKLLNKIPLSNLNDRQRVSIYKEFLRLAYDRYLNNNKEIAISFIQKVEPFIENNMELFGNEWHALNGLIEKAEPEKLVQIDVKELISIKNYLQEENNELRQLVVDLEYELEKINFEHEKLILEQIKQTDDFKNIINKLKGDIIEPESPREYKPKILVIGASEVKAQNIYISAERNFGIPRENIDINNDYQKNKRFSIKTLQYNSKYDGILIGPIAHKICDIGDNNSLIQALRQEGYPSIEEIRIKSGKLKITNTAIKDAMDNLLTKIYSNTPST